MKELLRELCMLDGVAGYEDDVRAAIEKLIDGHVESKAVDATGNLIVFKKGKRERKAPVMLCAHMDEVGFLVHGITEEGMIRLAAVGSIDPRVLVGCRMKVGPKKVPGVISLKAVHLTTPEDRVNAPKLNQLYVDIGARSRKAAEAVAEIGDPVYFDSAFYELGDGCVKAKAIDDRVGCAVLIKLIQGEIDYDTWFVFSVGEEISRGAVIAARRINPAVCGIVEGTAAADMPDVPEHMRSCCHRRGAAVSLMDKGTIYNRELRDRITAAADREGVRWQYRQSANGSTDAGVIHKANAGCAAFGMAVPTRYIHSACNVAYMPDVDEVLKLARVFIKETGENNA